LKVIYYNALQVDDTVTAFPANHYNACCAELHSHA